MRSTEFKVACDAENKSLSNDFRKLKKSILECLQNSTLVLLEGDFGTGKSFLLERLFPRENIFATKSEGINTGSIDMKAFQRWKARTGNVAVDETGWLTHAQLTSVVSSSIDGKKGLVLAMHKIEKFRYLDHLGNLQQEYEFPILGISLVRFDHDLKCPIWRYY